MLAELVETLDQVEPRFLEIARAYRTWALAHPNLYRLVNSRPLPRAALPVGLEETGSPAARQGLRRRSGSRARRLATINGLIGFDLAERFPPDTDVAAAYAAAARAVDGARPQSR